MSGDKKLGTSRSVTSPTLTSNPGTISSCFALCFNPVTMPFARPFITNITNSKAFSCPNRENSISHLSRFLLSSRLLRGCTTPYVDPSVGPSLHPSPFHFIHLGSLFSLSCPNAPVTVHPAMSISIRPEACHPQISVQQICSSDCTSRYVHIHSTRGMPPPN